MKKGVDLLKVFRLNPASLLRRITVFETDSKNFLEKKSKKYLQFENEACRKIPSQGLA
jgi:hypothetical protein